MPVLTLRSAAARPSSVNASSSASPSPGVRITLARSCQRRSAKNPPSEMTSAVTASGWSHAQRSPIITPQSCTTSATCSRPSAAPEALERVDVALPRAGRIGRGVAVPGEVGGDRAHARPGERGQQRAPHVRGLRPPCTSRATGSPGAHLRGAGLPVGDLALAPQLDHADLAGARATALRARAGEERLLAGERLTGRRADRRPASSSPGWARPAKLTTLLWRVRPRRRSGSVREGPSTSTSSVRPRKRSARSRGAPLDDLDKPFHALDLHRVGHEPLGELGRLRAPPRREDEREGAVVADLLDDLQRLLEVGLGLTREADDDVGRQATSGTCSRMSATRSR